jgi:hypothetical protein
MSAFKKGQRADGPFSKPAELNEGKGNPNGDAKGTSIARDVWNNNDAGAIRGGSENRDKKGT